MRAAAALASAEAAGVRFLLLPDGVVKMEAAAAPPPELLDQLRRWRGDVAHLLALREWLPCPSAPVARGWRDLPYGRERGLAFNAARSSRGACTCCAGRRWWRGEDSKGPPCCMACHPPPPGLSVREVLT